MPLPSTMTPIATQTLNSAAASMSFTNIPQQYTDLYIVTSTKGTNSGGSEVYFMRFNSDSGTNYSYTEIYGSGVSAGSGGSSNSSAGSRAGRLTGLNSTEFATNIIHIQNYSSTSVYKTSLTHEREASGWLSTNVSLWRSTSAITSITFYSNSGYNTGAGSTVTLYGIKAA